MSIRIAQVSPAVSAEGYKALIKNIYQVHKIYADYKIQEYVTLLDEKNPFFKHGSVAHFIARDENTVLGHLTLIHDTYLSDDILLFGFLEFLPATPLHDLFAYALANTEFKKKHTIAGPVQLTTWNSYRCSIEDSQGPFVTEPFTPAYYHKELEKFGFTPIQENISTLASLDNLLSVAAPVSNIRIERINASDMGESLRSIHTIICNSFNDTWNYVPIDYNEFHYAVRSLAATPNILLCGAYQESKMVGFILAYPNHYNLTRKELVIKIVGVLPSHQGQGIGPALFQNLYRLAKSEHYVSVIFSTMRIGNHAILQATNSQLQTIFRHYNVYQKTL